MSEKLLLLSRTEVNLNSLKKDHFHVSDFLTNLAEDSLHFHPNLEVRESIEPGIVWQCDQGLAQQLIHNLYTNAINYNTDEAWLRITLKQQAGKLLLSFENPSEAVSADFVERAFDRFYRGPDALAKGIEGHGLGLSLCQEIAKVHGGLITVDATADRVCMTLSLPVFA